MKYPKWKLSALIDYTGGLNNEVFKFLEALQMQPIKYTALPEPPLNDRARNIARDFDALTQGVKKFKGSKEDRLKWEWGEAMKLDNKYPHLDVMKHYRGERRFEGLGLG